MPPPSSRPGPTSPSPRSTISGAARRCPQAALVQLAEADAFRPSLRPRPARGALGDQGAARRAAAALRGRRGPRGARPCPEAEEPAVALRPMTAGGEVVEDYRHVGLTLRQHPVAFLRDDLRRRRIVTCAEAMQARDGRWLEAAGLVLVRQRPGSAKGVMFITLEDETGIANLVVWPKVFEQTAPHHPVRQHDGGARPHPARGRGRPPRRPARRRSLRRSRQRRRTRDAASRCRMAAATRSATAAPAPTRASARPRPFAGATSPIPTAISTSIKVKTRDFR